MGAYVTHNGSIYKASYYALQYTELIFLDSMKIKCVTMYIRFILNEDFYSFNKIIITHITRI